MPPYQSSNDVVVYVEGTQVLQRRELGPATELVKLDSGFSATEIALNRTGSLLAVAARKTLSIWIVDADAPAQRLRISGLEFDHYIRGLAWHPCAREDACLVVLTQHAVVSIYCPPGEMPVVETTRLADAEDIDLEAAGFSFGSADAPAGALTLYVGTTEGDIYAICPFAAPEIELPKDRFGTMRELASLDSWPVELDSWSPRHGLVTILKRPARDELPARLNSEPLRLVPYPDELYEEEVLDLAVGGLGLSWAADLVVQTTKYYVNFLISGLPLNDDELVLASSVKFARPQKVRKVRLVTPHIVIIDTLSETHVLHIEGWVTKLEQIRREHAADPAAAVPASLPPTQVEKIPLSHAYYTPRALSAVPVTPSTPARSWPLRAASDDTLTDSLQSLKLESGSFVAPAGARWQSLTRMDVAPSRPPTAPLDANLAALYELDDVSQSYESKISPLLKALIEVQFDRQTQKKELLAQLERAAAVLRRLDSVDRRTAELPKAVSAAAERQHELSERIRKVTKAVTELDERKAAERPLCAAEERWFDELETQLSQRTAKAQAQFADLQKSIAALKSSRETRSSDTPPSSVLTNTQIRAIRSRLHHQESLIASLKTSLDQ